MKNNGKGAFDVPYLIKSFPAPETDFSRVLTEWPGKIKKHCSEKGETQGSCNTLMF